MGKFTKEDDQTVINEKDIKLLMLRRERESGMYEAIKYLDDWFSAKGNMDKWDWEAMKLVLTRSVKKAFIEIE